AWAAQPTSPAPRNPTPAGAPASAPAATPPAVTVKPRLLTRKIPSSGELVPVIGLGTSGAFDVGETPADRADVEEVLKRFFAAGGTVIDTAPSYGRAEGVVGELVAKLKPARKFLATKVSASGIKPTAEQIDRSFRALRVGKIDLMQIHSLKDWQA